VSLDFAPQFAPALSFVIFASKLLHCFSAFNIDFILDVPYKDLVAIFKKKRELRECHK